MNNEKIVVPRNFILLGEVEDAEKGTYMERVPEQFRGTFSYGLATMDDNMLLDKWNGFITTRDCNIRNFNINVGSEYPFKPPEVTFVDNPPNSSMIDSSGKLLNTFPMFRAWREEYRIFDLVTELQKKFP